MGAPSNADQARQQTAQALAQARNIPLEEASQQVAAFKQEYQQEVAQTKQAATEAADAVASTVPTWALVAFVALVLCAISGWFGGRSGAVHRVFAHGVVPRRRAQSS
jgi:type VI protein secretion system component VasF